MSTIYETCADQFVEIHEVGPREGFQSERIVPTERKIKMIRELMDCGLKRIQATALVHPKVVPQHADAADVLAGLTDRPKDVKISCLIPNVKGAERAATMGADEWDFMLSVSESYSRVNANCTVEEAQGRMKGMLEIAAAAGVKVEGGMGNGLGCPFEGRIAIEQIYRVVDRYQELGITKLSIADTVGMSSPDHVYKTMRQLLTRYPDFRFKLHLHDTRGMGLANAVAALEAGVRCFDASIGGLGGCPFAPKAAGNVATEDLVHMLDLMGMKTGIDLERLLAVTDQFEEVFGHPATSSVSRAGPANRLSDIAKAKVAKAK